MLRDTARAPTLHISPLSLGVTGSDRPRVHPRAHNRNPRGAMSKAGYQRALLKDLTPAEYDAKFGSAIDFGKISEAELRRELAATCYTKDGKTSSTVTFRGTRPNFRFGRSIAFTHTKTPGPYQGKRGVTVWGMYVRLNDPREAANAKVFNEVLRSKLPPALMDPATNPVADRYKDMFHVLEDGGVLMPACWETTDLWRQATDAERAAAGPGGSGLVSLVTQYDLARDADGNVLLQEDPDGVKRGRHVSSEVTKDAVKQHTRGKMTVNIAQFHIVDASCGFSAYAYEVGVKSAPPAALAATVDDDPEVLAAIAAAARASAARATSSAETAAAATAAATAAAVLETAAAAAGGTTEQEEAAYYGGAGAGPVWGASAQYDAVQGGGQYEIAVPAAYDAAPLYEATLGDDSDGIPATQGTKRVASMMEEGSDSASHKLARTTTGRTKVHVPKKVVA